MDVLGANRFRPVVCSNRCCGYSTQARNGTCCNLFDNLIGAGEQRRWNLEGACF